MTRRVAESKYLLPARDMAGRLFSYAPETRVVHVPLYGARWRPFSYAPETRGGKRSGG